KRRFSLRFQGTDCALTGSSGSACSTVSERVFDTARGVVRPLMNFMHHAFPARAAGKMEQRIPNATKSATETAIRVVLGSCINRPVDDQRPAHNSVSIDKPPVTAIPAAIAVIAHYKISPGRNDNLAMIDVVHEPRAPLRAHTCVDRVAAHWRKIVAEGIVTQGIVDHVWLVQAFLVDVHL